MEENNHVEDPVSAVISEENIVYFDDLLKATVDTFFREGVSLSHHLFDFPNFANHTAPIETPKESQVPRQFDKHEFPNPKKPSLIRRKTVAPANKRGGRVVRVMRGSSYNGRLEHTTAGPTEEPCDNNKSSSADGDRVASFVKDALVLHKWSYHNVRKVFMGLDRGKKGWVSRKEFKIATERLSLGLTNKELSAFIAFLSETYSKHKEEILQSSGRQEPLLFSQIIASSMQRSFTDKPLRDDQILYSTMLWLYFGAQKQYKSNFLRSTPESGAVLKSNRANPQRNGQQDSSHTDVPTSFFSSHTKVSTLRPFTAPIKRNYYRAKNHRGIENRDMGSLFANSQPRRPQSSGYISKVRQRSKQYSSWRPSPRMKRINIVANIKSRAKPKYSRMFS
jgi:hypothetical protein